MGAMVGIVVVLLIVIIIGIVMMMTGHSGSSVTVKLQRDDGRTVMAERGRNTNEAITQMLVRLDQQYKEAKTIARKESLIEQMEFLLSDNYSKMKTSTYETYMARVASYKQQCIDMQTKAFSQKQFATEQRRLMSDSLRYDVMKRDGFKCVLCGATASDGAKLHVDHIIPIAKGGKTEMSNLRTLCDRCNLGKGVKLEKE